MTPSVVLTYNSQAAGGRASWVGLGWDVGLSYVQRDVNYTPSNLSDDKFNLFLNGQSFELVYVPSDGRYHTSIESYLYIENKSGSVNNTKGDYWVVRTTDGTKYRFGYYNNSEAVCSNRDYVTRWGLDEIEDMHGNHIYFNYSKNPNTNDIGAVYLSKIEYNNDRNRSIEFILENSGRPDNVTSYEQGCKVRESRRLWEIVTKANGNMVRTYVLNYTTNNQSSKSLLSSITEQGSVEALPPVKFEYYPDGVSYDEDGSSWLKKIGVRLQIPYFTLADINGDGLSDIAVGSYNQDTQEDWGAYLNNGTSWNSTYKRWALIEGPYLGDPNTTLMDVNGDMLPDIVYCKYGGSSMRNWTVYLNNGTNFNGTGVVWATLNGTILSDGNVTLADVNGDNLPDIVKTYQNSSLGWNWTVWLNNGSMWSNTSSYWGTINASLGDINVTLADVNGDGLPDIVKAPKNQNWTVWLNKGDCWESDKQVWSLNISNQVYIGASGVSLSDVDGDGLSDIVKSGSSSGHAWLNNGKGWSNTSINWTTTTSILDSAITVLSDADGDGLLDAVKSVDHSGNSSPDELWVFMNGGYSPNLLYRVNNGFGGVTEIQYAHSTEYNNSAGGNLSKLPMSVSVVSRTLSDNGLTVDQNVTTTTTTTTTTTPACHGTTPKCDANYCTADCKCYHGEGDCDSDNECVTSTACTANVGAKYGCPRWVDVCVTTSVTPTTLPANIREVNYTYAGGLYDTKHKEFRGFKTVNVTDSYSNIVVHYFHQNDSLKGREYTTAVLNKSGSIFSKTVNAYSERFTDGIYAVYLNKTDNYAYDGVESNPKITVTKYWYDNYSNVIRTDMLGDNSTTMDDRYQISEYANNTGLWIVSKPKRAALYASDGTTKISETKYYYDEQSYGEPPLKGDLTTKECWLDGGVNPTVNYTYDHYGNVVTKTDALGHTTRLVYNVRDSTCTYPEKIINALGQESRYKFELGTGNLLWIVDSNGFNTSFEYDSLGRLVKEVKPYDSSDYPTVQYTYYRDGVAPEGMKVASRETVGGGTLDSYTFVDGFGSIVQSRRGADDVSKEIVVNSFIDNLGRVARQSVPYLANKTGNYSNPDSAVLNVSTFYDPLGRMVSVRNTDGTYRNTSYDHWVNTVTDENAHFKVFYYDAFEQIIKVEEHNGNEVYNTTYGYNTRDDLVNITDNLNNTFRFEYDSLDRMTGLRDPDLGNWTYAYDAAGNLV
ncbi:MAG: toxin TcdB middle/N-terminal domain-containing protein, partial [Candidatus Altiarchaeota archaeon]|nr:toxin TcdB middle/N-terminal domain-containing protein [Candidatus Altiarchaeota archaeon]